jgi:predicted ATPase/DNA-binding SARP family transcriptional activator/DNA-binding CsgD family transcriptional regulator
MGSPSGFEGVKRPEAHHERLEPMRVWLLGGFRVCVGSRTMEGDAWHLRKAAALVKLLSIAPGHRLHRERAMHLLWPDLEKKAASNNLRQALHIARRTLASDPGVGTRYLASEEESLVLCPEGKLWVDVESFEEAAATSRHSRTPAVYRAAIHLYAGEFLPEDRYEEWAEACRQALQRMFLTLLFELAGLYEERREYSAGIEALQRTVSEESANEEAHAGLMRLYALSGKQGEALAQYERLQEVLSGRLSTQPGTATRRLRDEIAAGRFPQTELAAPLPEGPLDTSKHNLPAARTNFVGREREMVEVKRMLAMTGLLSLTGTGGCGKTRLALEVSRDLVGAYPDGVWLSELAGLSEGDLVAQEVAGVLGVREQPSHPILETLIGTLREKKLLLVLDNCEHLIDAVVQLVETLADSCPDLRFLATSREALGITDELVWHLPSLSVPESGKSPAVEELAGYESAQLFVERARYRNPSFALTLGNARAVAEICQRLDGIPLAIELAAARTGMLTAEQIATRLRDSLTLLTGGDRTVLPRQRTLRGTLDWSYDLLSERERRLFGRIAVFAGGWTLEAAEAVGVGEGIEDGDVLDLLSQLVDRSLVTVETAVEGAAHLRILETVRQYAHEKLEAGGEADEVRRRHAVWFLGLAEEAESGLTGARQGEWLERLETEHDNLRVALSWSLDSEEAELSLRLVAALWWFWYAHGYLSEGRRWLEGSLSLSDSVATQARAWALNGAGWIAMFQGEFEAAKTFLEEALALFRKLEDREGIASTLANLGFVAMLGQQEDIPVPALLEEARELRPRLRNRRTVAYLLLLEGVVVLGQGDLSYAMKLHEESLALLREVRDVQGGGGCLFNMGLIDTVRADYSRATELLRKALGVACEAEDKNIIQLALFGLANVAARRGQPTRAAQLWGASEAVREAFDMRLSPMTRSFVGYEANLSTARSWLGEAAFEEAWAEGKAMAQPQAIEYALSEEEEPAAPTTPVPQQPAAGEPAIMLTPREEEVAVLMAKEFTNRQIASHLMLSEHTVTTHIRNILKKLGLHSRREIPAYFREQR